MVLGLRQFSQRTGDGAGEPVLDIQNSEELMHVQPSVSVVLGTRAPESPGTLYITSKQLIWLNDADRTKGYAVDFLSLSLHAVSTDPESYPSPCIYTQIATEDGDDGEEAESDTESGEALDLSKVTEMRLLPSNASQLNTLFEIFCECAELNPEPIEEEEDHNWVFSADQLENEVPGEDPTWHFFQDPVNSIGHSNGDHDLANNVLQLHINDQRFEDAEEVEQDKDDSSQH